MVIPFVAEGAYLGERMDEPFFFRGNMLPTKGEVFKFINTRTKFGSCTQDDAISKAAKKVGKIWEQADTCPMSKAAIIKQCEKLLKDRQDFLKMKGKSWHEKNVSQSLTPTPTPRKRRFPGPGRQPSKRASTSKYKTTLTQPTEPAEPAEPAERSEIVEDVSALLSEIVETVVSSQSYSTENMSDIPCRKNLRANSRAEHTWFTQVGSQLFDVFSEYERAKVISKNGAFDEEFLSDQRGPRKLCMDTSKVTKEFELSLARESERERRHKNYVASATMDYSAVSVDSETTVDENDEVFEDLSPGIGEIQYISAVRTRSSKNLDVEHALKGNSKRSIACQTDESFFPSVSTKTYSRKNKTVSRRLNPRLLATGSLMMGVAGVSTKQAILCTKIAANTLFHQNYILPPSLVLE